MELLKQKYGYGCGLYSVANALCMPEFITPERLEESKPGNNFMQLNKWLLEDKCNFQIVPIYYRNETQFRTPKIKPSFENCPNISCSLILITFKVKNSSKNHMIAIHYNSDYSVLVMDSCKEKPELFLTWDSFREKYPKIISLEIFKNFDDKEICMM